MTHLPHWLLVLTTWLACVSVAHSQYPPSNQLPPDHRLSEPAIIQSQGYSLQQPPLPSSQSAPQIQVQPNGQRIFSHFPNVQQPTSTPPQPSLAPLRSDVQTASWTAETTSATARGSDKPKQRIPLELKSSSKEATASLDKPAGSWGTALSMVFSLVIVLSAFLLLAWFIKKSQPGSFLKLPGQVVQVLGRTPMAPRQQMYVVRFGSKMLLISHQPGQTQTLGEITDLNEVERLAGLCEANQPNSISHSFRDVLRQVTSGRPERKPA